MHQVSDCNQCSFFLMLCLRCVAQLLRLLCFLWRRTQSSFSRLAVAFRTLFLKEAISSFLLIIPAKKERKTADKTPQILFHHLIDWAPISKLKCDSVKLFLSSCLDCCLTDWANQPTYWERCWSAFMATWTLFHSNKFINFKICVFVRRPQWF